MHMAQVASSQIQILGDLFRYDEHVIQREFLQLAGQVLGLVRIKSELLNVHQTTLLSQLRQYAAHGIAIHLAIQFLAMILRTRGECYATTTPDRNSNGAGTGPTATLLTLRLTTTAFYFG